MSTRPKNVVELRRELAEKFPGVRMSAGPRETLVPRWPTGLAHWDELLGGGLPKSAITEVVSSGVACGSSLLIAALVQQSCMRGEWLALIDGADSFDPSALANEDLERLLWIRCANAREAIKAADLVLHDGTAALAILDLTFCSPPQMRGVPSSTWFRLERLAENIATALLVLTPQAMISNAEVRLKLEPRYSLESLELPQETLLNQLQPVTARASVRIVKTA